MSLLCALFYNIQQPQLFGTEISGFNSIFIRFMCIQNYGSCRSISVEVSGRTQEFCSGGGVQQIQWRTEDRENGDLGSVAP